MTSSNLRHDGRETARQNVRIGERGGGQHVVVDERVLLGLVEDGQVALEAIHGVVLEREQVAIVVLAERALLYQLVVYARALFHHGEHLVGVREQRRRALAVLVEVLGEALGGQGCRSHGLGAAELEDARAHFYSTSVPN